MNGAARRWAQKLGVDPYTNKPVLHDALVSIGKIDAAGSLAVKVAVPIPTSSPRPRPSAASSGGRTRRRSERSTSDV